MSKVFWCFGLIGIAFAIGVTPLAIQGITDTPSVKIFPQMTYLLCVLNFLLVGLALLGIGQVLFILDRMEKSRP